MSKRSRNFQRKRNTRAPHKVINIYTEGKETEPNYFKSIKKELRLKKTSINIKGCGYNTMSLVKLVIEDKEREDPTLKTEWWVVFDKDDHNNFNESIRLAQKNGINVAYSNDCFEFWFLLHFTFRDTAIIDREEYKTILKKYIGKKYEKNSDIYSLIKDRENTAIRNAKKLELKFDEEGEKTPKKRLPSTLVYKLVQKLRAIKKTELNY